jgi:hypothetical protein
MPVTVAGSAMGRGWCRFWLQKGRRLGHEAVAAARATEVKPLARMLCRRGGTIFIDTHATDWINSSHVRLPD